MPVRQKRNETARVRIPGRLHANFDDYFSALQIDVLQKAVLRASARGAMTGDFVLVEEDFVAAAQEALPDAATGLKKALSRREPGYVRRAS